MSIKKEPTLSKADPASESADSPPEPRPSAAASDSGSRLFFTVFAVVLLALHVILAVMSQGFLLVPGRGWLGTVAEVALWGAVLSVFLAILAPLLSRRAKSSSEEEGEVEEEGESAPAPLAGNPVLSFLFHDLPFCSLRLDREGRIKNASVSFALLIGREVGGLSGSDPVDLASESSRLDFRNYIGAHMEGEIPRPIEVSFSVEGKERVVAFGESRLFLPGEAGEKDILICGLDVTERRELSRACGELKDKVRQAARMEELGLLAGGVAHDIKNIINPLLAYPEVLLRELPPDSSLRDPVIRIKDSARRARDSILNFLALARRGKFEASPVDLNDLIKGFMASAELESLKERFPGSEVVFRPGSLLPELNGAESQINNLVMNLVRNAFEAGKDEGGVITVSTSLVNLEFPHRGFQQVPRGAYVLLTVSDQGKGMDAETVEHLLDPFFSRKKMGRSGSGLGMAVVAGVIEDHRGYFDVKSQPGQGTTFNIYFPCPPEFLKEREGEKLPVALVIDPDYDARFQAKAGLSKLGYEVLTAGVHEEGMRKVAGMEPDLIVLDLSGLEASVAASNYEAASRALGEDSLLILTGDAAAGLGGEGACILPKPVEIEDLRRVLHQREERKEGEDG